MKETFIKLKLKKSSHPCIVFLHGDFKNHTYFENLENLASSLGYSTLSLDFPGHGLSESPVNDQNPVDFLSSVLKENKIEKPIIIAHSSGGIMAIDYILQTSNATSLFLINSPFFNPKQANPGIDWDELRTNFFALIDKSFKKQDLIHYPSFEKDEDKLKLKGFETTHPQGFKNIVNYYLSLKENDKLFDLNLPILYLLTEKDPFIPEQYVKERMNKLRNGKLLILEGTHNLPLTNPEKLLSTFKENQSFLLGQ